MASDRLLSELQRQQKYLNRLPGDFTYPLFNAKQAIESQRASAYRNTAAAGREIVDNALEAGADKIHVVFDAERGEGNRRLVDAIAFIDNGSGMLPQMARYALSWGGGTHFDDPSFIGKFGFGLPNASINQTKRVEVYTRTSADEPFAKAWLDIREYDDFGVQSVPEAVESELPEFVQRYLDRRDWDLDHGTIVVWVNPDRLSYRTPAHLKEHLIEDFGIVYRYLLAGGDNPTELVVEGVQVKPVDPLFLQPQGQYYLPLEEGGAELALERLLPVRYYRDPETGERRLGRITDEDATSLDASDPNLLAVGTIAVRLSRFPVGFATDKKGSKRDGTTVANRRFEIRKAHYGLSFVRNHREIQTIDAFPRSARDKASGLGQWPLLQAYAYHVGFEVRFSAELDEVFGITNDKQSVRPMDDFWRVLAQAGIDEEYSREYNFQKKIRKEQVAPPEAHSEPTAAELSARDADVAVGSRPHIPERELDEANDRFEEVVKKRAAITGEAVEEARKAAEQETKRWPYRVDYYESEDGPFYKPEWVGSQGVVFINRKHPFYQVLYGDLLQLPGGARAKEAVDLLMLALGKAELTTEDDEQALWYEAQRKQRWSPFLATAMKSLEQRVPAPEPMSAEGEAEVA